MASGKNKSIILLLTFISAIVFMVGCYSLATWMYEQAFNVSSHRNVGIIFISFFFLVIATPILLFTLFTPLRINLTIVALAMLYHFYEWFSVHPLRMCLMAVCFITSYLYVVIIKNIFFPQAPSSFRHLKAGTFNKGYGDCFMVKRVPKRFFIVALAVD